MIRQACASLPAIALAAVGLPAQATWSSFEDRANHALTTEFNSGMVAMFGGASTNGSGLLLDDTITRNNQTWQPQTPPSKPTGRKEHAMAGGLGPGDAPFVILFGGLKSTGAGTVRSNDTWRYDGSTWGEVGVPAALRPSVRSGHGMIQDLIRNRIIMIGGLGGIVPLGDVWEFDPIADSWSQRLPAAPVMPGRYGHAMAWDPVTGTVLVFGGNGYRQDTWEYDPVSNTWANRTPAGPNPVPGRVNASMAYHPLSDRLVLFGGATPTGALDDTWTWDRVSRAWQATTPAARPPARHSHTMTPEANGSTLLVHGGTDAAGVFLRGTWNWTGTNWVVDQLPPARDGGGMAYQSGRQRHLLFGGRHAVGGADLGDTWELDGLNWLGQQPANSPGPRADAGIAFDRGRQRGVLFGGRVGGPCGTALGDTWEWDGQNWAPRAPANSPPPAGGVQPVYDTARNRIWMLVGDDMWQFDGNDWRMALPAALAAFCMAHDPLRDRLVLFGGQSATQPTSSTTWSWDGATWLRLAPPTPPPPARRGGAMAFDAVAGRLILFGGYDGGVHLADTWAWSGSSWSQLVPATSPPARADHAMVHDIGRSRIVLFGGTFTSGGVQYRNDTWEWDGANWQNRAPSNAPSPRVGRMAHDPVRQRTVLFGGYAGSGNIFGDTWEWNGTNWGAVVPATTIPPPRWSNQMATDPVTGRVIMFGGWNGSGSSGVLHGDTWIWSGTDWTLRPGPAPSARTNAAMALMPSRGTAVLFGGVTRLSPTEFSDETWQWDGSGWLLANVGRPATRTNYGAAYDERRDRVVVFGGRAGCASGAFLNETWEWDGAAWLQRRPAHAPSPRERSWLAYDAARGRVVLFGGTDGTNTFSDSWEWNGDDWLARLPAISPPGSAGHGLSHDQGRRVTVGFGRSGTWDYGPTFPASIAPYGQGCQGTAGVPELRPTPWAGPWLGDRMEIDILRRPPGFGLMVYGFSDTLWNGLPLPLPISALGIPAGNGCTLQSSVEWSEFLPSSGRYTSFPMPTLPIALGFTMHMQAGFLDAGTPGFPVVVSQGLHITFGAK